MLMNVGCIMLYLLYLYTWFLMRSTYSCNIEYILKDQGLVLDRFMNGSEKMDKHSGILWGLSPYI
jgi:hypothetical protein